MKNLEKFTNHESSTWKKDVQHIGNYLYATDAIIAIRKKADLVKQNNEVPENSIAILEDIFQEPTNNDVPLNITNDWLSKLIEGHKETVKEVIVTDCEECDGEGKVIYEYEGKYGGRFEEELDCPVCDGRCSTENPTGKKVKKMPKDLAFKVFPDKNIAAHLLEKILGLAEKYTVTNTGRSFIKIAAGEYELVIMKALNGYKTVAFKWPENENSTSN